MQSARYAREYARHRSVRSAYSLFKFMPAMDRHPMIMSLLKEETKSLHQRVEKAINLPARLASIESYTELLARFRGLYAPLESQLSQLIPTDFVRAQLNLEQRRKVPLIDRDLQTLDWSPTQIAAIPNCQALPSLSTAPEQLGILYVVEGSTLGGQIIQRMVHKNLGFVADHGCAFFSGYGDQTATMWKQFRNVTTRYAELNPQSSSAIIAAASKMFVTVEEWLG